MKEDLKIIIPTRNDPLLEATIRSIRKGFDGGIIVVDDASDGKLFNFDIDNDAAFDRVVIMKNVVRVGPGPSRQLGADQVQDGWLLFSDSHMVYPEDWYEIASEFLIASDPGIIWGTVYRQHEISNPFWFDSHDIGGADFYWWRHHDVKYSFIDLAPRRIRNRPMYEAPMPLGGCYFVHTSLFRKFGGFRPMVGYGSEESWMGWNAHLRGGAVFIMGNLFVTHILRQGTGHKHPIIPEWEINRLLVARRVLHPELYRELIARLPLESMLFDHIEQIVGQHQRWFDQSADRVDHDAVAHAFNQQTFDEAIELLDVHIAAMHKLCPACKNRRWLINGQVMAACPRCNRDRGFQPRIDRFSLLPINE